MATFTNPHAFAAQIASYGGRIDNATPRAVKAAADIAATAMRRSGSRFRIKGRTGKRWALGAKVTGPTPHGANWWAIVQADPIGMWTLVQSGARPHVIKPRRRGRGGRDTRKALAIPGMGYFAKVNHPGTGRIGDPWGQGLSVAKRVGPETFQSSLLSSVGFGKAA